MPNKPIVFFDGVCELCNGFVDFLFKVDRKEKLLVASLQGQTAQEKLSPAMRDSLSSVVFYDEGTPITESSAIIAIAKHLPLPWRAIVILRLIPRPIRDAVYRLIARNRYKIFGQRETCRIATPHEKARMLP